MIFRMFIASSHEKICDLSARRMSKCTRTSCNSSHALPTSKAGPAPAVLCKLLMDSDMAVTQSSNLGALESW